MNTDELIHHGVDTVAQMMVIAAITAPKAKGENFVVVKMLHGPALQELSQAMAAYGEKAHKVNFDRDGRNVAKSDAVLLIGLEKPDTLGSSGHAVIRPAMNCSTSRLIRRIHARCAPTGCSTCIALGSAVKTASLLNG
jgi:uncharacterized ferredoxin-like protein